MPRYTRSMAELKLWTPSHSSTLFCKHISEGPSLCFVSCRMNVSLPLTRHGRDRGVKCFTGFCTSMRPRETLTSAGGNRRQALGWRRRRSVGTPMHFIRSLTEPPSIGWADDRYRPHPGWVSRAPFCFGPSKPARASHASCTHLSPVPSSPAGRAARGQA